VHLVAASDTGPWIRLWRLGWPCGTEGPTHVFNTTTWALDRDDNIQKTLLVNFAMIDTLPGEILATAFELGVLTVGPRFLPPVCLVCRSWNDVARNTPRLWGIIDIYKHANPQLIQHQLARCKAAPLTVFFSSSTNIRKRTYEAILSTLLDMSENWESAVVPLDVFEQRAWPDMYPDLEELVITSGRGSHLVLTSFGGVGSSSRKLRKVALEGLHLSYMKPFLSPYLKSLSYIGQTNAKLDLAETIQLLCQAPNLVHLKMHQLDLRPQLLSTLRIVSLPHLETLDIAYHEYPSLLLSHIAAPNLKTVSIDHGTRIKGRSQQWWWNQIHTNTTAPGDPAKTLTPFLSQWCDSQFLPERLHTLNLMHCIKHGDLPVLASFLQRVPALVRLSIVGLKAEPHDRDYLHNDDDVLEDEAAAREVFRILSSTLASTTVGGSDQWLLPALTVLQLELQTLHPRDLIEIAQKRGVYSSTTEGPPKRLRTLFGFICSGGDEDEVKRLKSLVATTYCTCIGCSMSLMSGAFSLRTITLNPQN
jgi:F-box-like